MNRLLLHFSLLLMLVYSSAVAATESVTIALASNFSKAAPSSVNPYLNQFVAGIELALEKHEAHFKKIGLRLVLEKFDYGTDASSIIAVAELISKSSAIAAIGFNSSHDALLAAPILEKARIPVITPTATANRIAAIGEYVFQMAFNNSYMGEQIAHFIVEHHFKHPLMISVQDCAYCTDLAISVSDELGREHIPLEQVNTISDFSPEELTKSLQKANIDQADVVIVPNYEIVSAQIIKTVLDLNLRPVFIGGDSWENATGGPFLKIIGDGSSHFKGYYITDWHPQIPLARSKTFSESFQKRFQQNPIDDSVLSFDAMDFMLTHLKDLKIKNRMTLATSLSSARSFDGLTGYYRMVHNSAPHKSSALIQIDQGNPRLLKWIDNETK